MNYLLLILCMMLVTYIPRMLPSLITDKIRFGKRFKKFLDLVPYAAMAALIFPGVLGVDEKLWIIGVAGAAVAVVLSLIKKMPLALVVIAAVLTDMAIYYFI